MSRHRPLVSRTYKNKRPIYHFYCPLCSTPRSLTIWPQLRWRNYVHIALISSIFVLGTFVFMQWRTFIWPFIIFAFYEFALKTYHRKEIPCPHCGFDAFWYRRDVKMARQLVDKFWEKSSASRKSV